MGAKNFSPLHKNFPWKLFCYSSFKGKHSQNMGRKKKKRFKVTIPHGTVTSCWHIYFVFGTLLHSCGDVFNFLYSFLEASSLPIYMPISRCFYFYFLIFSTLCMHVNMFHAWLWMYPILKSKKKKNLFSYLVADMKSFVPNLLN